MFIILDYLKSCNIYVSIVFLTLNALVHTCTMLSSFWLKDWANDSNKHSDEQKSKNYRVYIYSIIGVVQCVFSLFSEASHTLMFINATRTLHKAMLSSILKSTIRFFESTPVGRIINRKLNNLNN